MANVVVYITLLQFKYRTIPKISPGAYISQSLFLRGLFLEGLNNWAAFKLERNLPFWLCFTFKIVLKLRAI